MVAHWTSHSPALSCLIDGPVCLTDGQMCHGRAPRQGAAPPSCLVLLRREKRGSFKREREKEMKRRGEREGELAFFKVQMAQILFCLLCTGQKSTWLTFWGKYQQGNMKRKVTGDRVYVASEGLFSTMKRFDRESVASGLPGGSAGYSARYAKRNIL